MKLFWVVAVLTFIVAGAGIINIFYLTGAISR